MDCSTLWREGYPRRGDRHLPFECEKFAPELSSLPDDLSIYTSESLASNPMVKAKMELAADALLKSRNLFSTYGIVPRITLIQSDEVYFGDSGGRLTPAVTYIGLYQSFETCPIILYTGATTFSDLHFQQMVAHEVFHCFQQENFQAQAQNASQNNVGQWWFEGIPQFMSNLVYPSNDFEYSRFFGTVEHTMQLWQQESPYQAEHFFQSYFNNKDNDVGNILNIMAVMPVADYDNEAPVFASVPGVQNLFHLYGQNIADKKLMDSSGAAAILPTLEPHEHLVESVPEQQIFLAFIYQTLDLHRVTFPKGGHYRLFLETAVDAKVSVQKTGEREWQEMPSTFDTTCDEEKQLDFLVTTTVVDDSGLSARLKIQREERTDCQCDVNKLPADQCLYGRWAVDHSTVLAMMNRTFQIPGSVAVSSTGQYEVDFNPHGDLKWTLDDWSTLVRSPLSGGMMMNMRQTMDGVAQSKYSNGSGIICSQTQATSINLTTTVTIGSQSRTVNDHVPVRSGIGNFTYSCEGNTLIYGQPLDGPAAGTVYNYVFHRL